MKYTLKLAALSFILAMLYYAVTKFDIELYSILCSTKFDIELYVILCSTKFDIEL